MHLRSKVVYSPHQKCFWGSTTSDNLAFELAAINLRDFFGNPLNLRWLHICDILIRFHILEASISLVVVRYVVLGAIKHWHLYVNPQWAPGQSYGRYCHKYSQIVTAPQILVILVVVRRKTRQYSSRRDLHFTPEGSDGIGKNIFMPLWTLNADLTIHGNVTRVKHLCPSIVRYTMHAKPGNFHPSRL